MVYTSVMKTFTQESMYNIILSLKEELKAYKVGEVLCFEVLNPDICNSTYSGEEVEIEGVTYLYRSYTNWTDLSQALFCKFLTPKIIDEHIVQLRFLKLNEAQSFHKNKQSIESKYGTESEFSKIHKNEESSFLMSYMQALNLADIQKRVRILNLGVNSGDEFELILQMVKNHAHIEFVGIDYCQSAIEDAQKKFNGSNMTFYAHDINALDELDLGTFDLIISIGTLQSSSIDFKLVFMSLIQKYLKKEGAIILGFPNCRWSDGEMIYGAKIPNYSFSDMTLLIKDIYFCKKYLQQKRYKVYLSGKNYIFLTGIQSVKSG